MAGLHGRLCISGRVGRQPEFSRTDQLIAWDPPSRERRPGGSSSRATGTSTGRRASAHFAEWSGLAKPHAQALWELSRAQGGSEDLDGVRLLGPGDPQLQRRDRETLVPDAAWRKQVWAASGGSGVVTEDGKAVALWRARKQGKTLEVTLEGADVDVQEQADRLAPHRGCSKSGRSEVGSRP